MVPRPAPRLRPHAASAPEGGDLLPLHADTSKVEVDAGPGHNGFPRQGESRPAMATFLLERSETLGDDEYPASLVAIRLQLDLGLRTTTVPQAAQRRIAWRLLKEMLADIQPEELQVEGLPETEEVGLPPISVSEWAKPQELDMRIIKSAHRMVLEVAQRGASGRSVLASELVGAVGLSAPTVGRLLKDGEPANEYLRQFIQATPAGRTKALDLTPKGRLLASKIRAGTVPA